MILWRKIPDDYQTDRITMRTEDGQLHEATLIRSWWSSVKYRWWLIRGGGRT